MPPSTLTPALTSPATVPYIWLIAAILLEVGATACLAKTEQFRRLLPLTAMVALYGLSFYCLSQALKTIPLGIAYALWGGLGIALTTVAGILFFRQSITPSNTIGIGLIIAGVVVLNAFSRPSLHG